MVRSGGAAIAGDLLARIREEIDARRAELRPLMAEYEELLTAAAALEREASPRSTAQRARKRPRAAREPAGARPRAARDAAQQAILAALEHGSHTAGELSVVTAMSGPSVRESLRRLLQAGAVTRARREGKAAYALAGAARR